MRNFTVSDYLYALQPDLPVELVSPANFVDMVRLTSRLPGALTDFLGLECHLTHDGTPADLSLCASVRNRGREVLAGNHPSDGFPETFAPQSVWRQLYDFAALWCEPSSALYSKVRNVWLEFDLADPPPPIPVPNVLFGSEHIRPNEPHAWLTQTALPCLSGSPVPQALEKNLVRCIQTLPRDARVFQIGMMLARDVHSIRICIRGLRGARIARYLSEVGWHGGCREFEQMLDALACRVDQIDLDLDIGERVGPKIGLECSFQDKPSPDREPRWLDLMDYLVERRLCLPLKRQALLAYPGVAHEWSRRGVYPAALLALSELLYPRFVSLISRGLHHIKITFQDGQPQEAKAYLSARHHWFPAHSAKPRVRERHQAGETTSAI